MSTTANSTQDTLSQQSWLQLYLQPEINGQEDGSVMVRWCAPRYSELADLLKAEGVTKPYVLLVVRPYVLQYGEKRYQGESLRKLVPLVDEASYVSFSRPGLTEILACIVGNKEGKGSHELGGVLTYGQPYGYKHPLFEHSGELVPGDKVRYYGKNSQYHGYVVPDSAAAVTVDVPEDMFAPEYPKWRTELVGKFHHSKREDQCDMFWSTVRSFGASVLYFPFAYLARVVQLVVCLWFGMRGISLRGFRHPIQGGFNDVAYNATTSFWFKDKNGKNRSFLLWPLNPVTPVVSGLILWAIGTYHVTQNERIVGLIGWDWWQYFAVASLAHIGAVVLMLVVMAIFGIISAIVGTSLNSKLAANVTALRQSTKKARARAALQRKLEAQMALERELAVMACTDASRRVSLDALPKEKQTFKLRMQAHKSKSCKPIAR